MSSLIPPLDSVYFYLTEGCNLACRHCWLAPKLDATGDRYPTLPVEAFEAVLCEARPLGLTWIKLTGGEPLLHPGIARILEISRREEARLVIETNGVLCSPALAGEIAKSAGAFVSVSLDGADASTHEAVRGVPGSFEAACRGIRHLAAAGLVPQVIFTVMKGNIGQVDAVVGLAQRLGAGSVKFNVVQPTLRGERLHQEQKTPELAEIIRLGRRVEREIAPATPLRLFFDLPSAFRPLSRLATGDGCAVCGILGIIGVLASGHYALCGIGENIPELVFGEVGKDPLEKVWRDTPVLRELRKGMPGRLTGVCSRCLMKGGCLGACVAQNFYRSRDLWAPHWFCQRAEEEGLFPASRLAHP